MSRHALPIAIASALFAVSGCVAPGRIDGEVATCPVHGVATRTETRAINYGLYRFPQGYLEAERELFPLAHTHVGGGCVVGWDKFARVRYCPECREAERAWHASRPDGWKE